MVYDFGNSGGFYRLFFLISQLGVISLSTDFKNIPESKDCKGSYAFISLGCPKNTVDSERMMGLLKLDGYQLVSDPVNSDFVVVNTCGFIEQARQESFGAIDEMLELKKAGKTKGVIVSGCLAERQKEQLLEDRPEIDSLVGVFGREEITKIADRLVGDLAEQRSVFQPAPDPGPSRPGPASNYTSAFCLPEDLRRLRSALYVLRDSENARQACDQTDGVRHCRSGATR